MHIVRFVGFTVRALMFALLASLALQVHAQEATRVGFVNIDRIMRESGPAQAAQARLEQEFSKRDKELQDMANRLKGLSERLEKDGPTLSQTEGNRRRQEIVDLDREFQRKQREFREDLSARQNQELQAVLERANRVVKEVADRDRIDIVFQEAVYANPRIDITDKVLRALNGR
jgi:outer membrane protein